MVEPGVATGRLGLAVLDEAQQFLTTGAQGGLAIATLAYLQADGVLVEADGPVEVGHRDVHGAEVERVRELGRGAHASTAAVSRSAS